MFLCESFLAVLGPNRSSLPAVRAVRDSRIKNKKQKQTKFKTSQRGISFHFHPTAVGLVSVQESAAVAPKVRQDLRIADALRHFGASAWGKRVPYLSFHV